MQTLYRYVYACIYCTFKKGIRANTVQCILCMCTHVYTRVLCNTRHYAIYTVFVVGKGTWDSWQMNLPNVDKVVDASGASNLLFEWLLHNTYIHVHVRRHMTCGLWVTLL